MNHRVHLRFKAAAAALFGAVLLLESVSSAFLRSHFEAWAALVNLYIAIFGTAFLIQSWKLVKQIPATDSK
jgi:hypothetical protein